MEERYDYRDGPNQLPRPNKWRQNDTSLYSSLIWVLRSQRLEDIINWNSSQTEKKARVRWDMDRQTKIKLFLENICSEKDAQHLLFLNWLLQLSKEKKDHEYLWISYLLFEFFENFKLYNEKHLEYKEDWSDKIKKELMEKSLELKNLLLKFRKKFSVLKNIDKNNFSKSELQNYQTEIYTLEQISGLFNIFLSVRWIDTSNSITWILGEVAFEEAIKINNPLDIYICELDESTRLDLDSYKWIDFVVCYKWAYFLIDTKAQIKPPQDCKYIEDNIAYKTRKFKDATDILTILENEIIHSKNSLRSKNLKKPNIEIIEIYLNTEHLWIQKTQDQYSQNLPHYIQQILEKCEFSWLLPSF